MSIRLPNKPKTMVTDSGIELTVFGVTAKQPEPIEGATVYWLCCAAPRQGGYLHIAAVGSGNPDHTAEEKVVEITQTLVREKLISRGRNAALVMATVGKHNVLINYQLYVKYRTGEITG